MTLSVGLCNYNHGEYLRESLNAVLGQSRPADEIVVLDDGSTDDSIKILEELALEYPQIRLIRNDRNMGLMYSLERVIDSVSGRYVFCPAADDRILPGFFESALSILAQHPGSALCCGRLGTIDHLTGEEQMATPLRWQPQQPRYIPPMEMGKLTRHGLSIGGHCTIFDRQALKDAGGFRSEQAYFSDWFTFQVMAFRQGICYLPQTVALYRWLPSSFSASAPKRERLQKLAAILDLLDTPEFEDVRWGFRMGTLNTMGFMMFKMILLDPKRWKWLSAPYVMLQVRSIVGKLSPDALKVRYRRLGT